MRRSGRGGVKNIGKFCEEKKTDMTDSPRIHQVQKKKKPFIVSANPFFSDIAFKMATPNTGDSRKCESSQAFAAEST